MFYKFADFPPRFPDLELQNFYPIFTILNSFMGTFLFAFMGLASKRFRKALTSTSTRSRGAIHQC
jgi:hypothetical protein